MTGKDNRQLNEAAVRRVLLASPLVTKQSMAKATGLSIASCRNILEDLLQRGEIFEREKAPSTGGRPSRQFSLNPEYRLAGLLIVRRSGRMNLLNRIIIDMRGHVLAEWKTEETRIEGKILKIRMEEMRKRYPGIAAWGWGIPAVVSDGTIGLGDFPQLQGLSIPALTDFKDCIVENDVNAAAMGFFSLSTRQGGESLAYLYYPDGEPPGAGIVIRGEVLRGHTHFAGELSYLPLGVSRGQMRHRQSDAELALQIVKTVQSINAIINPPVIVLTGKQLRSSLRLMIREQLRTVVPKGHLPDLVFEENMMKSYRTGLAQLTLQQLYRGLQTL